MRLLEELVCEIISEMRRADLRQIWDALPRDALFYHGTRAEFSRPDPRFAGGGGTAVTPNALGFYLTTDPEVAKIYVSKRFDPAAGLKRDAHVTVWAVDAKNPYFMTEHEYWKITRLSLEEIDRFRDNLESSGYDSIVMPSVWRGRGHDAIDIVVFDPDDVRRL